MRSFITIRCREVSAMGWPSEGGYSISCSSGRTLIHVSAFPRRDTPSKHFARQKATPSVSMLARPAPVVPVGIKIKAAMPTPLSLRLYLASVPGEMDGERAVVEGLVLPELRERAQGLGIEIVVV